jgi:uncharacterized protein YbaR (Trm112 family)
MKTSLLDIICCPVCKGDLVLHVTKEDGPEIVEGSLTCPVCRVRYPICEGIPDLIPRDPGDNGTA